jgi:hypothetical protein
VLEPNRLVTRGFRALRVVLVRTAVDSSNLVRRRP